MSLREVTIEVVAKHDDGTTVSRRVSVGKSLYTPETALAFRKKVKRNAIAALNAVVGTSPGIEITNS